MASSNYSKSSKVFINHGNVCIVCLKIVSRTIRDAPLNSRSPAEVESRALLRLVSNNVFRCKESLENTGIEVAWNFLDTLNLVWPSLVEEADKKELSGNWTPPDGLGGGKFTEIPPICQLCADRIQAVRYFKRLSDRYLKELRKRVEEAKSKKGEHN